ncbi:zinc finger CCCH domain-containing protein 39-like [Amaranthus tricolor]|uniref:zinc finger CCCH domain-containing protein 39-like n=1 Tax=Amaranthus tricolor TaxID=29722 RepID=UPI0025835EBD|nr:zinc finger CCCH domain-containing protein 39-like [Amaranthus tricolor]XP_057545076.1 zinc finger CCCH domain-containing protein 39-like [Amaranthus tricolor]
MSSSDSFPFPPNGLDSMDFWPQLPISNEESEYDHPPMKKYKNASDNQPTNRTAQNTPPVNQPNGKIFFKTRLCAKFRMGQCKNGENCNFAHGEEDLRKPPPNWQELVGGRTDDRRSGGSENWDDDDRIILKMKLCKKFYNGEECPYGERCNFSHKEPPKFRENSTRFRDNSRESFAISIGTTGSSIGQSRTADQYDVQRMAAPTNVNGCMDGMRGNSRPVWWKTKLCIKFENTGYCPFGDNCHYAHGQAELLLPSSRSTEAELAVTHSVPLKPGSAPNNDPTPVKSDMRFASSQDGQAKKCLVKWKATKKINRIYGDWIDDLPLTLPTEVET